MRPGLGIPGQEAEAESPVFAVLRRGKPRWELGLGAEAYLEIGGGELSPGGQKLIAGGERREGSTTLRHS